MLIGLAIVLAGVIGTAISYNASRGLPLVPVYEIHADVPDAAELVEANSDVRIGTARIGVVKDIQAMPAEDGRPPFARLTLGIDPGVGPVRSDTTVEVRPRSALGAKYVDLIPGSTGTFLAGGDTLPIRQSLPATELDAALEIFDQPTRRSIQSAVSGLGDGLAGRGSALNRAIAAARNVIDPATRVTEVFAGPDTNVAGAITATARLTGALAPVAGALGSLIRDSATTAEAFDDVSGAFTEGLDQLAPTETLATEVLTHVTPVLDDAAAIARKLAPGTRRLPAFSDKAADTLEAMTPVIRRTPRLADDTDQAFSKLDELAHNPLVTPVFDQLGQTVKNVGRVLDVLGPAQIECNAGGIWARNLSSAFSSGDRYGSWVTMVLILDLQQMFPEARPARNLHVNSYPNANATECESGNEPYPSGIHIGNPKGKQQKATEVTKADPKVRRLGRRAGLIASPGGKR